MDALPLASALPERVFLQTGGKYYGVHLGPTTVPQEESDPRVPLEPNLYYAHEDILTKFCQKHGVHWNIGLPSFILGAPEGSAQTLVFPLAVYAAVQKYLKRPLEYPSDIVSWEITQSISSAILNSYLFEWAVLTNSAANQSFNASDDCAFTWGKFWPKLAQHYNMEYIGPDTSKGAKVTIKETPYEPPPRGFGPRARNRSKFSFVEWAKRPDVSEAWKELVAKYDLQHKDLLKDVDSVFGRADFALTRSYSSHMRYVWRSFSGSRLITFSRGLESPPFRGLMQSVQSG